MLFRGAVALGLLRLVFGFLHDTISGASRDTSHGFRGGIGSCFSLLPFSCFFGLGHTSDELDESVTVSLGRNGRDLGFCVCETLEEVFHPFDERVLKVSVERQCQAPMMHLHVSDNQ